MSKTLPTSLRLTCWITAVLTIAVVSCAESVKHDEVAAAKTALDFARTVFLEKNPQKGYEMLSQGGKRHVPLDKFRQTIAAMHPRNYPTKVTALEFEPMAGEKAIYVFLTGRNEDQQFSYRVTLEGTAATGYKVLKVDQGMSFPTLTNQKQAFKPPLSIP
ncbi:MAG TPA: hypothetical protein VIE90_18835 [Candidatus Binatia bacterium]